MKVIRISDSLLAMKKKKTMVATTEEGSSIVVKGEETFGK